MSAKKTKSDNITMPRERFKMIVTALILIPFFMTELHHQMNLVNKKEYKEDKFQSLLVFFWGLVFGVMLLWVFMKVQGLC